MPWVQLLANSRYCTLSTSWPLSLLAVIDQIRDATSVVRPYLYCFVLANTTIITTAITATLLYVCLKVFFFVLFTKLMWCIFTSQNFEADKLEDSVEQQSLYICMYLWMYMCFAISNATTNIANKFDIGVLLQQFVVVKRQNDKLHSYKLLSCVCVCVFVYCCCCLHFSTALQIGDT